MAAKQKILITGANGQLGRCVKDASLQFDMKFTFLSREELNIENAEQVNELLERGNFSHCINTAAYTNVEKAESEVSKAMALNADGTKTLALACSKNNTVLMHISTDYVFDGNKKTPYIETDPTNPLNVYGSSKLKGEQYIQEICEKFYIFRTSWLYSQYGHNFLKTILRYSQEGKELTITTEQTGAPTNANDLALAILKTIERDNNDYGIYHFSNKGETTWYGFAKEILQHSGKLEEASLAETNHYRTFAARPKYSVLDNSKIQKTLAIPTTDWKESLEYLIKKTLVN